MNSPEQYITCGLCGKHERLSWMESTNQRLIQHGECFTCNHFMELAREPDQSMNFRVDGTHYKAHSELTWQPFRGFGGQTFKIHPLDGRPPFLSNNVWCQGSIPEHLRTVLPDNAKFIKLNVDDYRAVALSYERYKAG